MNKTLVMTIGLSRSGKSTWSKKQGLPIISADSLRHALTGDPLDHSREKRIWKLMSLFVESLFLAGNNTVILDCTSLNESSRNKWRGLGYDLKFKLFDTTPEECLRRGEKDIPGYYGPIVEFMRQKRNFNEITEEDLWDISDAPFLLEMKEQDIINQKNSHLHGKKNGNT